MEPCTWCWRRQDHLTVTVQGDEQSPALCDDCTGYWKAGVRKYRDKVALVTVGRLPNPTPQELYDDHLEDLAEERANPDSYDFEAMADEAAEKWERNMDRMWP